MVWWIWLIIVIICSLVSFVIGCFVMKKIIEKEMKKNPPINEKMIRAMFLSMGRKPSESQINVVMNNIKKES